MLDKHLYKNFIRKYINIFLILFLICLAVFLRSYNLTNIYTEYDDIGVLTLHKFATEDKHIKFDFLGQSNTLVLSKSTINNFENSLLFPFYIGYSWTDSPGQYFFHPLITFSKDTYLQKLLKYRSLSVIFSLLTLFVIYFSMNNIFNIQKNYITKIFILSSFVFSSTSILYAHHMGPYSVYCLMTALGVLLCAYVYNKKISYKKAFLINSFLVYFAYTNVLFFISLLFLQLRKQNIKNIFRYFFYKNYGYSIIYLFLLFPIFLLLFQKRNWNYGSRGVNPEILTTNSSIYEILNLNITQTYLVLKSLFSGFFVFDLIFQNYIIGYFVLFVIIVLIVKNKIYKNLLFVSLLLFIIIWIILFNLSFLPFDQTRHALILFPVILLLLFIVMSSTFNKYLNIILILSLMISIFPSAYNNINLLNTKISNFDFQLINKLPTKNIITFEQTLSPGGYFQDTHNVFNISFDSFVRDIDRVNFNKFALVSQSKDLNTFLENLSQDQDAKRFRHQKKILNFLNKYNYKIIVEKYSDTYFTYNNYPVQSNPNGFFLYYFYLDE